MEKSNAKDFIDSLIALGIISGCAIGIIIGMFFKPSSLVFTVSFGTGIGYIIGVIAYGVFSKE